MQIYILKRLVLAIPSLIGISLIVFMVVRLLPGDVVDQLTGEYGGATPEQRAKLEERFKINNSLPKQYIEWAGELVRGNLGDSIISGRPIMDDLKARFPVTLQLVLMALLIAVVIGLPIGVLSAVKQDSILDYASRSLAIFLIAAPNFWLGLLAIAYGFRWFGWTPPLHYEQVWDDPVTSMKSLWVPALIMGGEVSGAVMRLSRSAMLEVLRQDYIRTAWSKGLQGRVVVVRHALRNSLLPVVSLIGVQVPVLIGGTVILERIFSIPGMGNYLLSSIQLRDYPVVQAIVLISALLVVVSNLAADVLYAVIDPRIRYA